MSPAPFIAIADDLTGAAEIAALGFRHGLDSLVVTTGGAIAAQAQLVVYDTDSRLDPPSVAAQKLTSLARDLGRRPVALIYKKTDSVLRGAVRAEVEALARALGQPRVILLPANPSLGRTICDGYYSINGVPLDQTPFARDPHHPARSASVLSLLGDEGLFPVAVRNATDPLAPDGLIVGNAASASDVHAWARQVTSRDLPAGGGEFFSAILSHHGFEKTAPSDNFAPGGPTLIVSGTTSSAGALRVRARRDGVTLLPLPQEVADPTANATAAIDAWIEAVRAQLAAAGATIVLHDGPLVPGPLVAGLIRRAFARCVRDLIGRDGLRHVIVEGGATAASIARECRWDELRLAHEWAQGVASLRPAGSPSLVLTMKPGSYAWPEPLWAHILRSRLPV